MNRRTFISRIFTAAAAATVAPAVVSKISIDRLSLPAVDSSSIIGNFSNYIFPVVMNCYPELIATELISVKPMNAPSGAVFYMDLIEPEPVLSWWQRLWSRPARRAVEAHPYNPDDYKDYPDFTDIKD